MHESQSSQRIDRVGPDPGPLAAGNVPVSLTPLIGRDDALTELVALLWESRLLVLCGPGGIGKSRLAAALAERVRGDLIGGAWWVDLSSLDSSRLVARAVGAAVLPGLAASDPVATVARELSRPALLVLDNAEQVSEACAEMAVALLGRAPQLRILVTSRQSLGVPGERVWRVPGLAVEPASIDADAAVDAAGVADARELFVQRAREAAGAFDADAPGAREVIAELCRWLDGNPLAIELAAARVPVLSVSEIGARLQEDLGFLRHTRRASPDRQRALTDTLEWSHRLLSEPERRLFARLGVFRGGFSLPAAERVCPDAAIARDAVLDLIGQLVDRSLVHVAEAPGPPRFRLAPTVRQFALGKLDEVGEEAAIRARHADCFAALMEADDPPGPALGDPARDDVIELDLNNLRDALRWLGTHAPDRAARLACALWPFARRRGYYEEARRGLEAVLAAEPQLPDATALEVLIDLGEGCFLQCDYADAVAHLQRACDRLGAGDEPRPAARIAQRLGSIARERGDYAQARRLHGDSRELWESIGDAHGVAVSDSYLAFAAWLAGDLTDAQQRGARALAHFRATQQPTDTALALINLGAASGYADAAEEAVASLDEALRISRRLGFQEGIAWSLHVLAIVARRRRGSVIDRELMLRDALLIHHRLGDRWRTASVLEEIAGSPPGSVDATLAATLLGAAERLRERIGAPIPPVEADDRERTKRRLRRALGDARFREAAQDGAEAPLDELVATIAEAIERVVQSSPEGGRARVAPVLTSREIGVLELLGAGATNREIADTLYISASTAGVHVSNILRKLGAKRRVDAAAHAQALGLLAAPAAAGT